MSKSIRWELVVIALSLFVFSATMQPPSATAGWFIPIDPPNGGPSFDIGPWSSLAWTKDWCGSALFRHGPLCFTQPSDKHCAPTGNGFIYPTKGFSYPVRAGEAITDCAVFRSNQPGLRPGFYFLSYGPYLGSVGPFGSSDGLYSPGCYSHLKEARQDGDLVGSGCFCVGSSCRGPNR